MGEAKVFLQIEPNEGVYKDREESVHQSNRSDPVDALAELSLYHTQSPKWLDLSVYYCT